MEPSVMLKGKLGRRSINGMLLNLINFYRWISVTNAIFKVDKEVYLNARGYVSTVNDIKANNTSVVVNFVNYEGEEPSWAMEPTHSYPVENSLLWVEYQYDRNNHFLKLNHL